MPLLNRDGVDIYYEIHGSGPTLLLTHGFGLNCQMWRGQIAALSQRHRLIVWDMRGHGQSGDPASPAAYSKDLTVGDMAALLDSAGAGKAIIGGLSLGGVMSLQFHYAHPTRCRALMLLDTGPGFKKDEARETWNKRALERAERYEKDGLKSRDLHATHRSAQGQAHAARGILTQQGSELIDTLADIRVPTLVLVGADDEPFIGATDYMAKKIPGAQKVVISGAGHLSNIDQPEAFNTAVTTFLNGLPA